MTDREKDGIYTFWSDAIFPGSYRFKVTLDESWARSYPGSDVEFALLWPGEVVKFS